MMGDNELVNPQGGANIIDMVQNPAPSPEDEPAG